jgi:hypothetical protein
MTAPGTPKRTGALERKDAGGGRSLPNGNGRMPLRAAGHIQLTERDCDIIIWVARHGIVTVDQIAAKFFPTPHGKSAAFQRVRKLCDAHPPLLQRTRTHYREPSVLRVTTYGSRLADIGLAPARIVPAEVHHALAIVDLAEELLASHPGATLLTERERRAQRYREKRSGQRKTTGRIPDAVLVLPSKNGTKERTIAVELDRSPRSRMDAETVIKAYIAEKYDQVLWYVRPNRVDVIRQLVRRMKTEDFIEVRPWQGR